MNDKNPTYTDQMNTDKDDEATLLARLRIAPGLGDVHATVNDGVAILTGKVREAIDIKRAVLVAQAVEGIREVREEIQVAAPNEVEEISTGIPTTRDAAGDFTPLEEAVNPTTVEDENNLASVMQEGMNVFDSEGNKVGSVKMVRESDFLLSRLLARNYYVPFFACTISTDGVHLKVKGSEINDQGWAFPHMEPS